MATNMDNKACVEIGVLEECESYLLESRFFPNKLGGKPAWLDLKNIPSATDLTCGVCSKPCIFLCQIYAPMDDDPRCHHRTLFVFLCPDPTCCKTNQADNFVVLRNQLPQINPFYPKQDPTEEENWHPECKVEKFSTVCVLCGVLAPFNCGKCRSISYCSKEHQIADWKMYGHRVNCGTATSEKQIEVPLLFPEFEITIDKPPEEEVLTKTEEERMEEYNKLVGEGQTGTLATTSASVLEQYSCVQEDKYFSNYKKKINECPEQVLRYERGGTPMYIASPLHQKIEVCQYCKGERQFELQILSTMLNEMGDSVRQINGLDWGTLLIYTCKASCGGDPAYKRELIIKQDVS